MSRVLVEHVLKSQRQEARAPFPELRAAGILLRSSCLKLFVIMLTVTS